MLGRTISHYRIVSQLGAGGMGVVYAAEDVRLGRPVALKFVPEELAADHQAVERFRVEARAASALNHPHICTIYDIGEDDGRPFIVMELLKGQTLRDRLAAGPMKIHHIVDAGIQIADALDAAHSHGIVHRDIKPANLFLLDRGQVKIMDFGLAKLALENDGATTTGARQAAEQLTAPGVTLGTVSYMSPEQAAGDDLDGRTDLFSLGVVLYECATGHRPFTGNSAAVILSAILNKSPAAPVVFNPELPLRLQDVINNCLEKDRDLRYQTAADLRADLRRVKRDLESGRLAAGEVTSEPSSGVGLKSGTGAGSGIERAGAASTPRVPDPVVASASTAPGGGPVDVSRDGPHASGQALVPGSSGTAVPPVRTTRRWQVAAAASLLLIAIAAVTYFLSPLGQATRPQPSARQRAEPPGAQPHAPPRIDTGKRDLESGNYRAALAAAEDALAVAPDNVEAKQVREDARAKLTQFDAAMADARRLLRAGNPDDAARALERARTIDAAGPGVVELSAQVAEEFRKQAERARHELLQSRAPSGLPPAPRTPAGARSHSSNPGAASGATSTSAPSPPSSSAAPASPGSNPPAPTGPPATSPSAVPPVTPPAKPAEDPAPARPREEAPPASPQPPPAPAAGAPRTPPSDESRGAPPIATPPPKPSAADEEAAIKRVLATYARAIETKDLALFRSVKPNLSAAEEQRIEAGFRAVASQRVAISIESIERQGSQALVRLRRRDTIDAAGRRQTAESQQTMRLARAETGSWVIVEIGR